MANRWERGPHPQADWRKTVKKRIHQEFPKGIQQEALHILRRPGSETALTYMIDAGGEERVIPRFVKALRTCAYHATPPEFSYSFRDPRIAKQLLNSIEIILAELDFFVDSDCEEGDKRPCRDSLVEIADFVKSVSARRSGAPHPREKYKCLLHLEAFFRKWFKRPVHGAIAALIKATFPGDYREVPSPNTIQIELKRARSLFGMSPPRR